MPPAPMTGSPMNAAISPARSSKSDASGAGSSWGTLATSAISVPKPSRLDARPARLVPYAFMPW